jgi:two-component system response regulator HydG
MMRYDWPGNIRELENAIERACAIGTGPVLELVDLPSQLQKQGLESNRTVVVADASTADRSANVTPLAELERQAILSAIRTLKGDKLEAARMLGIGKTTLYRKLKEYGILDPLIDE